MTKVSALPYDRAMQDSRGIRGNFSRQQPPRPGQHSPASPQAARASKRSTEAGLAATYHPASTQIPRRHPTLLLAAGGALIVILAVASGFFFWQYKSSSSDGDDPAAVSRSIVERVSSLYMLPEEEEPTVAEIRDKDKLSDQAFFDGAQNGDYLIVYEQAGIALIYRESAGKLVNVSPVGASPEQNAADNVMGERQSDPVSR